MSQAEFIKSAIVPRDYPRICNKKGKLLPEVAIVGRSNVGKSSLLNHLFGTKHLVKTSSTPGKTQALNFFRFEDRLAFADLPGYGYAQVSHTVSQGWGPMVHHYIEQRDTLQLILFAFDIRRLPTEEDRALLDWIVQYDKGMILVLTKTDKLTRSACILQTRRILEAFGAANLHYAHYSVLKNWGKRELLGMIRDAIQNETSALSSHEEKIEL